MKCGQFLVTFVYLLSASRAFATPKSATVYSQVISYVSHLMEDFAVARGGLCFDKFIPLINSIADHAKDVSEICDSNAIAKQNALLRKEREELEAYVERIQDTLIECSLNSSPLGYLKCLNSIVDEDKSILDVIAKRSAELIKEFKEKSDAINTEKNICLEEVVKEAKIASDQAFADLQECVKNGQWPIGTTQVPTLPDDSNNDQQSQRTKP